MVDWAEIELFLASMSPSNGFLQRETWTIPRAAGNYLLISSSRASAMT